LTINLLQALPKTPLWDRLAASGRLSFDPQRESNVVFTRPYEEVLATWRAAVRHAYSPEAMFGRYEWNLRETYPNRLTLPPTRARLNRRNLRRGATLLAKIALGIGIRGDHRRIFWRFAAKALRAGRVKDLISASLVAHHMIRFARECDEGTQNAAFYADRVKTLGDERAAA